MATSAGPNLEGVKNNNLLLSFDTHDAKSYPGEPSDNYLISNGWGGDGNNQSFASKSKTTITDKNFQYNGYPTVLWTPGLSYNVYLNGSTHIDFTSSAAWTFSCYIRAEDYGTLRTNDNNLSVYMYVGGTSYPSESGSASAIVDVGNGWYRVSRSISISSNYCNLVGFFNFRANVKFYLSGWQLEPKNKATPFCNATDEANSSTGVGSGQSRPATVQTMVHGDVGSGTTIVDSSVYNLTITNNGATHSVEKSKFNGGSIKFVRSSSQVLYTESTSNFNFGTEDWSIDFWFNMTDGSTDRMHAVNVGSGTSGNINFDFNDGNAFWLYWNGSGSNYIRFGSDGDYGDGQWHHCAATRCRGIVRVWIDGVYKGGNSYSSSTAMGMTGRLYAGAVGTVGSFNHYWDGYLDEIRVIKGTALWKGGNNFDPPTRRGAGGAIIDRSSNRNDGILLNGAGVEATGPTTRRDGQVILPTSNALWEFDGTDDYLYTDFGNGRSTENPISYSFWVKANSVSGNEMFAVNGNWSSATRMYAGRIGNTWGFGLGDSGWGAGQLGGQTLSSGIWYNIAIVIDLSQQNGVWYTNGSYMGEKAMTSAFSFNEALTIGAGRPYQAGYEWTGRVAKVDVFNSALTATQIKQNFNQQRSRFGI